MLGTILNTSRAISYVGTRPSGLEKIGVRGYSHCKRIEVLSLMDFLKLIGVAWATQAPDERAVIKI